VFGIRLVFDALRHDEHFACRDMDRAVAKIDPQNAIEDDEGLVGVLVIVPDEIALELHDLELIVVHFGDDLRLPLLVEQFQLRAEIDRLVVHLAAPANDRAIITVRLRGRRPSPKKSACQISASIIGNVVSLYATDRGIRSHRRHDIQKSYHALNRPLGCR